MCSPIAPFGPDSVVMKPIFTVSAAAGAAATTRASSVTRTTRLGIDTEHLHQDGSLRGSRARFHIIGRDGGASVANGGKPRPDGGRIRSLNDGTIGSSTAPLVH